MTTWDNWLLQLAIHQKDDLPSHACSIHLMHVMLLQRLFVAGGKIATEQHVSRISYLHMLQNLYCLYVWSWKNHQCLEAMLYIYASQYVWYKDKEIYIFFTGDIPNRPFAELHEALHFELPEHGLWQLSSSLNVSYLSETACQSRFSPQIESTEPCPLWFSSLRHLHSLSRPQNYFRGGVVGCRMYGGVWFIGHLWPFQDPRLGVL